MLELLTDIVKVFALIGGGFAGFVLGGDRFLKVLRTIGGAPGWYERVWAEKAHEKVRQEENDAAQRLLVQNSHAILGAVTVIPTLIERFEREFANGVPPTDDTYVPMRKYVEGELKQNAVDHDKLRDSIEDLFEMVVAAHDDVTNATRLAARHDLWIKEHDKLKHAEASQ